MASSFDINDPDQLNAYLRDRGHIPALETPSHRVLTGGVSNRTVLVERPSGEAWVLKQALHKLNVAVDWFADPARVHREAAGLRWLAQVLPAGTVPEFVFEDKTAHILAMSAVPQPHDNWKDLLLRGQVDEDAVRSFGRCLGMVHRSGRNDPHAQGFFSDRSFFEALRLEPYYLFAAESLTGESADFLRNLVVETRAVADTVVHGDYSPKNVLIWDSRLVLLDHEVIHFGDGAFDVGFALTHLLSKAHHMKAYQSQFVTAARMFWSEYVNAATPPSSTFEARAVRHTLACLLARVIGRSPLEYLSTEARIRQKAVTQQLIHQPPQTIGELISRFAAAIAD